MANRIGLMLAAADAVNEKLASDCDRRWRKGQATREAAAEAMHRRRVSLLGAWVSELPAAFVFTRDGLMGLTAQGHETPYLVEDENAPPAVASGAL